MTEKTFVVHVRECKLHKIEIAAKTATAAKLAVAEGKGNLVKSDDLALRITKVVRKVKSAANATPLGLSKLINGEKRAI